MEPGGSADQALVTRYTHDPFGNILAVSRSPLTGVSLAPRTQRKIFDSRGRFVEQEIDALGNTELRVLARALDGQPTREENANGVLQETVYGQFGRVFFTRDAYGGFTRITRRACGQLNDCPQHATLRTEAITAGGAISRSYTDALGRTVRDETSAFDGRRIRTDTEFDLAGRNTRVSAPYFAGATPVWAETSYDVLGRPLLQVAPDGGVTSIVRDGWTTVTSNPLGQLRSEIRNALDELVEVIDPLGGRVEYVLAAHGSIRQVIDSAGNTTTFSYDALGRKRTLDDPDKGRWTYTYNAFGELVRQTNASGFVSTFTLDPLGRRLRRVDTDPSGAVESDSRYTFDQALHGIGEIAREQDLSSGFERAYLYDPLGRLFRREITIRGERYVQELTYDQHGRRFQTFDATGGGLRYLYNTHGFLSQVREADGSRIYQTLLAQDPRGQVTEEIAGNGIPTTRRYDPLTGRLTDVATGSDAEIQNLHYELDLLGNLELRRDTGRGRNLEERFTYDDLNRLSTATVAGREPLTLTYDALGNITSKSDVAAGAAYIYGAPAEGCGVDRSAGPHAVTGIGGEFFCYDAGGNLSRDSPYAGQPIASCHSLGTLTCNNLIARGLAESANLNSVPFGNVSLLPERTNLGIFDIVNGGIFGLLFNPLATPTLCLDPLDLLCHGQEKNYNPYTKPF